MTSHLVAVVYGSYAYSMMMEPKFAAYRNIIIEPLPACIERFNVAAVIDFLPVWPLLFFL